MPSISPTLEKKAKQLKLDSGISSLDPGKFADIVVLAPPKMILGDDRAVSATYVAGKCVYKS